MPNELVPSAGGCMETIHVLVLAVVQGLTEFLPISSDGHLVVTGSLLADQASESDKLARTVVLHAGTLLAVLIVYWQRICRLLGADAALIGKLIVGTLPAIALGLPFNYLCPHLMTDPLLAGFMLILTGSLLVWANRRPPGAQAYQDVTYRQALWIGLAQAFAILPGLSRSGCTIVAGLGLGLRRDSAATFSFLLAIPAIGGAVALKMFDLLRAGPAEQTRLSAGPLLLGVLVAFAVGWAALRWLLRWLEQGRLHYFAWWCIPLGAGVVIWQLTT